MSVYFIDMPFLILLLICVITDCSRRIIPDVITLPGTLYFVIMNWILGVLPWWQPLIGMVGLGGLALLLAIISKGKIGGGDIKLFAMIGAYIGWSAGIWIFLFTFPIAAVLAWPLLILKKVLPENSRIPGELPLAPFIGISAVLLLAIL